MSCKHPLKGFVIGFNPDTGKPNYKVTSYNVHHLEKKSPNSNFDCILDDTYAPNRIYYNDWIEIPCGQCIGCRLEYSRQWANRCALEMQYHDSTLFLTLTYDDKHLPTKIMDTFINPLTGEVKENFEIHPLVKKDMQDFMKSLRDKVGYKKLRFFGCGEYGSESGRPHLHIIVFGLALSDLTKYKTIKQGDEWITYYNSKTIDDCWKHKGFCVIAPATWETVAYTSRYVTKKLNGKMKDFYELTGLEPEFCLMSRKPGIGKQYLEDNLEHIFNTNRIVISNLKGSRKVAPPKYYKKQLEKIDEDLYNKVNSHNKEQAEITKAIKLSKTSLSYLDYLESEEIELKEKIKTLHRNKV